MVREPIDERLLSGQAAHQGRDVPQGVVAAVDPERLAHDVRRGLSLKLSENQALLGEAVESPRGIRGLQFLERRSAERRTVR